MHVHVRMSGADRAPGGALTALVATAAILTACGGEAAPAPAGPTVVDDGGHVVALPRPAARVFSAVPSITESIVALGAAEALVARTGFDEDARLAHLPVLEGMLQPSVEALAALRPELVVAWWGAGGPRALADQVAPLGIPVYRAEVQTLGDLRSHVRRLGVLLGRPQPAEALVESIDRGLARVADAVAGRERPRVLYVLWPDPPATAGPGTFIDTIIARAGGRNVFADAPSAWPQVSLEEIVRRDPDVLVIASDAGEEGEHAWLRGPGWRELSAVRRGRYLVVDGDLFNRPGPRVHDAAAHLARFLHGEGVLGRHRAPVGGTP